MWAYEKKLQHPVNIKNPNPKLAQAIITQLGGPDGELAASMRYLNQRYSCPYSEVTATLTDIGTEELAHMEIISAIVHQLTRNLSIDAIKKSGFDTYFVDHTTGIYPVSAAGVPFTMAYLASKGDLITDLHEDLAADGASMREQHSQRSSIAFHQNNCLRAVLLCTAARPLTGDLFAICARAAHRSACGQAAGPLSRA